MSLFLHLEDQTAQVVDLQADVTQDVIPQLLPLHSQLNLFLDALELVPDLRPVLDRGLHLRHHQLEIIRADIPNVIPDLHILDGPDIDIDQTLELVDSLVHFFQSFSSASGGPFDVILCVQSVQDLGRLADPFLDLLGSSNQRLDGDGGRDDGCDARFEGTWLRQVDGSQLGQLAVEGGSRKGVDRFGSSESERIEVRLHIARRRRRRRVFWRWLRRLL